jgi:hypothetical protein
VFLSRSAPDADTRRAPADRSAGALVVLAVPQDQRTILNVSVSLLRFTVLEPL